MKKMDIENYVEPSKKRIQKLIVEELEREQRPKYEPIIEIPEELFEI